MAKYFNRETTSEEDKEVERLVEQAAGKPRRVGKKQARCLKKRCISTNRKNLTARRPGKIFNRKSGLQEKSIQHKNRKETYYSTFYKYAAVILIALMLGSDCIILVSEISFRQITTK